MNSQEIRNAFLEFFERNGHLKIQGGSLIPKNDPSLLFVNSGMAPMKPYFTGDLLPPSPRLTNIQPCIRTNDIEDVGDIHHLTFFEMMGSWSINDYYKDKAIELAYQLLTEFLKVDKNKLYVSVYSGNESLGLPYDDEARQAWISVGIPEHKIVSLGDDDNFWGPAGDEGPCGPCTEVFIDTGIPGDESSYEATGIFDTKSRYIEIWNAGVFMELYKDKSGTFSKLNQHNVDTGAGLERLTMAINGSASVYDTDIYRGLNDIINSSVNAPQFSIQDIKAKRTLADHIRAATFILSEGVLPDKNKEGYIPRRLIRRCVAAASRLNIESFPYDDAIESVVDFSGNDYPKLRENITFVINAFANEQSGFSKILRQGEKALKKTIAKEGLHISGKSAFNLTASHGIPLDILLSLADKYGAQIDTREYLKNVAMHKEVSKGL